MDHPAFHNKKQHGFTLIELMVATSIMVIIVMGVLSMTANVLGVWSNASGRLSANAEARVALDVLGNDLETLVVRPNGQAWLEVEYGNARIDGTSGYIPTIYMITATENRPSSTTAKDYGSSSICAVSYVLDYKDPVANSDTGANALFGVYRTVTDPKDTFTNVLGKNYETDGNTLKVAAGGPPTTGLSNFLASHVADLAVDFYAEVIDVNTNERTGAIEKIDGDFIYTGNVYQGGNRVAKYGNIVYADIRMVVLTDNGVKRMRQEGLAQRKDIMMREGTVFTRRVPIMSRR